MITLQGFTNEDFEMLAKNGIWPNTEQHLKQFLIALVENLRDNSRRSHYVPIQEEHCCEYAETDGP